MKSDFYSGDEMWGLDFKKKNKTILSFMEMSTRESESLVKIVEWFLEIEESSCLGLQLKEGGIIHLKLNKDKRPIVKK